MGGATMGTGGQCPQSPPYKGEGARLKEGNKKYII